MRFLVLLASYNGEKYIKEQIDSILSQQDVDVSIKVFDDVSIDNTLNVLEHFKGQTNVEVIINNVGSGSAANNFLNAIKSITEDDLNKYDYVALADQDDIWLSEKLVQAALKLKANNASLYCSNLTKWDTRNGNYTLLKKNFSQKKFDFLFEGGSAGCTYVFTREFAIKLKSFLPQVNSSHWVSFSHDWLIYFFARRNGLTVFIDADSYIHYRLHDDNVHGHLNKQSFAAFKEKSKQVLNKYHENQAKNFINYLDADSVDYALYKSFLSGYWKRNLMIFKYNTQLMRDNKKFIIFLLLNLLKF